MPSGLVSTSASPGRAPTLRMMRDGCTVPSATRPNLGSGSSTLWPPRMATPGLGDLGRAALDDALEHVERQRVARKVDDVQGEQRPRAHGVDVAQRVGRGDTAPGEGVVDDGRDVVDRGHQRHVGADLIHGGVVRQRGADQGVRVEDRG